MRAIGRWSLAALMVNLMIGGGIFELPSTVAGLLGGQSPIAYLVAAAGMGIIAACVAEVASRFQQAGGPYLYAKTAFGRFLGIQTGWLLWLTRVSAAAAVGNVFIDYLRGFWPQVKGPATRAVVLTILIGGLAAVNIRGVKMGTWVSNFFTVAKLLPLGILLVGGLAFIGVHGTPVVRVAESHPAGAWMNAVLLLVFAYAGFEAALILAGHYTGNRRRLVDDRGLLRIPWPNLSSDGSPVPMDLLLSTSNDRDVTYPTVREIAEGWNQHPEVDYFRRNRSHEIETFQDQAIRELLR